MKYTKGYNRLLRQDMTNSYDWDYDWDFGNYNWGLIKWPNKKIIKAA